MFICISNNFDFQNSHKFYIYLTEEKARRKGAGASKFALFRRRSSSKPRRFAARRSAGRRSQAQMQKCVLPSVKTSSKTQWWTQKQTETYCMFR